MHESDQPVTGPDPSTPADTPSPKAGMVGGVMTTIQKHPKAWIAGAAAAVFVLLGTGSVALGATVGAPASAVGIATHSATPTPTRTATATPTPTVDPGRPVPANQGAATRIRTCSVAGLASDGRLGSLEAQVVNAKTGQTLFDRNGVKPGPTASVLKTLTSAAALSTLGPDYRVSTT